MTKVIIVIAGCALTLPNGPVAKAEAQTAKQFLNWCERSESDNSSTFCLGKVEGITETLATLTLAKKTRPFVCIPKTTTNGAVLKSILDFIKNRTDSHYVPATAVVISALESDR